MASGESEDNREVSSSPDLQDLNKSVDELSICGRQPIVPFAKVILHNSETLEYSAIRIFVYDFYSTDTGDEDTEVIKPTPTSTPVKAPVSPKTCVSVQQCRVDT